MDVCTDVLQSVLDRNEQTHAETSPSTSQDGARWPIELDSGLYRAALRHKRSPPERGRTLASRRSPDFPKIEVRTQDESASPKKQQARHRNVEDVQRIRLTFAQNRKK